MIEKPIVNWVVFFAILGFLFIFFTAGFFICTLLAIWIYQR